MGWNFLTHKMGWRLALGGAQLVFLPALVVTVCLVRHLFLYLLHGVRRAIVRLEHRAALMCLMLIYESNYWDVLPSFYMILLTLTFPTSNIQHRESCHALYIIFEREIYTTASYGG